MCGSARSDTKSGACVHYFYRTSGAAKKQTTMTTVTHGSGSAEPVDVLGSEIPLILRELDDCGNYRDLGTLTLGDWYLLANNMERVVDGFDESLDDFRVDDMDLALQQEPADVSVGDPGKQGMAEMQAALKLDEENEEMLAFIKEQRTPATERKTRQTVARFQRWLSKSHEDERPMETIKPGELDILMGSFLMSARIEKGKRAGEVYEPDTLTAMHRAFDRHLREKNYEASILKDPIFSTSRTVLASKRKALKKMGKGNKPNKAEAISDETFELFWKKGLLGMHSPSALLHTVFAYFVMGFGMRPNHGSYQLKWGDVQTKREERQDGSTICYIEWNERLTKTRAGQLDDGVRAFPPKIYEVTGPRCPVLAYETYAARRPVQCNGSDDPFYLGINHHATASSATWYVNMQMGINTIIPVMSNMAAKAGLPGKITNHSLRRTMLTNLLQQNVPPTMIMQVSGHKSVESVNHYAVASRAQQRAMSNIIVGGVRPAEKKQLESVADLPSSNNTPCLENPTDDDIAMVMCDENEPSPPPSPPPSLSAAVSLPRQRSVISPREAMARPVSDSVLQGILTGAHVTGNVSININYAQANNSPGITLSPALPHHPSMKE